MIDILSWLNLGNMTFEYDILIWNILLVILMLVSNDSYIPWRIHTIPLDQSPKSFSFLTLSLVFMKTKFRKSFKTHDSSRSHKPSESPKLSSSPHIILDNIGSFQLVFLVISHASEDDIIFTCNLSPVERDYTLPCLQYLFLAQNNFFCNKLDFEHFVLIETDFFPWPVKHQTHSKIFC